MFYPKCGKEISKEAKFCPRCGFDLTNLKEKHTNEITSTKRTSVKVAFKVGIVMITILLFGLVFLEEKGRGEQSSLYDAKDEMEQSEKKEKFDSELKYTLIPRRFEITIKSPHALKSNFPRKFGSLEFGMAMDEVRKIIISKGYKISREEYDQISINTLYFNNWNLISEFPKYVSIDFDNNRLNEIYMHFPRSLDGIIDALYRNFGEPSHEWKDNASGEPNWEWNDGLTEFHITKMYFADYKYNYIISLKNIAGERSSQYWNAVGENEVNAVLKLGMSIKEFKEEIKWDLKPEPKGRYYDLHDEESYEIETNLLKSNPVIPVNGLKEIICDFWKNNLYQIRFFYDNQKMVKSEWKNFVKYIYTRFGLPFKEKEEYGFDDGINILKVNVDPDFGTPGGKICLYDKSLYGNLKEAYKVKSFLSDFHDFKEKKNLKVLVDETSCKLEGTWGRDKLSIKEFNIGNIKFDLKYSARWVSEAFKQDWITFVSLRLYRVDSQGNKEQVARGEDRFKYKDHPTLLKHEGDNYCIIVERGSCEVHWGNKETSPMYRVDCWKDYRVRLVVVTYD